MKGISNKILLALILFIVAILLIGLFYFYGTNLIQEILKSGIK